MKKILLALLVLLFGVSLLQVLVLRFTNPPCTMTMAWEKARHRMEKKPHRSASYLWRDLDEISPHLRRAVIAAEDQRFLFHHGFDFTEIRQVVKDVRAKRKIRGASTITMQAARSVFLLHSRTVGRKLVEAYYTVLMECCWDKHRILEIYLNTVDWGVGIVGAEAAANRYFSCSAGDLTPGQAALMTAILPSPHAWSVKRPSSYLKARQRRILRDLKAMPLL
ncbi:MAG: monofunctional biosynthetic peptidoglycan transglycosylase [Desulfobacteraceae bacterium]|nr:monofunctional biosynthetic peptidoglycan transglycosylase [Desulfobacteraceae bacterium]